ncbi:hypothetical protein ABT341_22660, partial [Pseudonocardia alni]
MALTPPVARTLHDVGLAAWFGGSLMGVTGLNGALDAVGDPAERERLAGAGWVATLVAPDGALGTVGARTVD